MYYPEDFYINDQAKEGQDPRQELEKFVKSHLRQINLDKILEDIPNLNMNDESWMKEFVRVNNPYTILETYFFRDSLKKIAVDECHVARDEVDVVGAILHELGFKRKVEPTGLYQIKEKLNQLQEDTKEMTKKVDEILRTLFLFYSYLMRYEAPNEFEIVNAAAENAAAENAADKTDKMEDPIVVLEKLINKYRKMDAKSLGHLYSWVKELMELIQKTKGFSSYCNLHFKWNVPLTPSLIAEIGMFRTYRNLVGSGHPQDHKSWNTNKSRVIGDLKDMDSHTREEWNGNWNHAVDQYEENGTLPETEMEQRMAMFFKKFINLLSDNEIYPKVIVMREYQVDAYGTTIINAVTSDPNETIALTDSKFFDPFSEFYYHSRTNVVGTDPILVSKRDIDEWENPPEENQEEQGNS